MFDDIILPMLTSQWGRRLCWGALGVASVLFLVTVVKTPITWYADNQLSKASTNVAIDLPVQMVQSSDLIKQIPSWHLFGNAEKSPNTSILPITSLQLSLVGVVHAFPQNKSSVIISEAGQTGKVYLVGDTLPVGVKVDAITEDGVILDNAGRLEKLPLQRQSLSFQGMPKSLMRED